MKPGEVFKPHQMAIDHRKVLTMVRSGHITPTEPTTERRPVDSAMDAPATAPSAEDAPASAPDHPPSSPGVDAPKKKTRRTKAKK